MTRADPGIERLDPLLVRIVGALMTMAPSLPPPRRNTVERWRTDADALRFHLSERNGGGHERRRHAPLVAVLGGTGTGKSTLVNRLIGANVTATSFRRTFTSGPVAIAPRADDVPSDWLALPHVGVEPDQIPARGQPGSLLVVDLSRVGVDPGAAGATAPKSVASGLSTVLIDTPDLDGDQPLHHAQADRAFRWAQAVVFLVSPEKYQMTELQPYYRLARRYAVPALYVMNKAEEQAAVEDYREQLARLSASAGSIDPTDGGGADSAFPASSPPTSLSSTLALFAVSRDDSTYEPPAEMSLAALRAALAAVRSAAPEARQLGLRHRALDLLGRLSDQVVAPLADDRREADRLIASLRALETPPVGVDVNPVTQQLQRRLQQRSILYLMGPQRILDRVRQAPMLLARLPRVAWEYLRRGEVAPELLNPANGANAQEVPDFRAVLADQFSILQSRIDDVLRASPAGARWIEEAGASKPYSAARIDPAEAGKIADEELADLKQWLEQKWNATPRDTRMIESVVKHLPGGRQLARWTEAAPYLLTLVLITHGAIFGHHDLIILGGYGIATWLSERLSNEVTSRTRTTNTRIEWRFEKLAHDQIARVCEWLDHQAPSRRSIEQLERVEEEMNELLEAR